MDNFYKNKKVFITGHTGFKGTWLVTMLTLMGANVTGYSLRPEKEANLFQLSGVEKSVRSVYGDIRNLEQLSESLKNSNAEIVFHLAAQPIVRESYVNPVYTYDVNVMGTVNILEAIRLCPSVRSAVNITTDKVYENTETKNGYKESDRLDGYEPYANSKSCSELITASYRRSFFQYNKRNDSDNSRIVAISTARAGNVIGGGDFAKDRIVPDCVRVALELTDSKKIIVRNPNSVRPYQHVLEPISAYLSIAEKQYKDEDYEDSYNVGPKREDCITTGELANLFCEKWGNGLTWGAVSQEAVHEAGYLKLNSDKIYEKIGYTPRWDIERAVEKTVEWTKCYGQKGNLEECMQKQVREFKEDVEEI